MFSVGINTFLKWSENKNGIFMPLTVNFIVWKAFLELWGTREHDPLSGAINGDEDRMFWDLSAPMIWNNFSFFR